MGPSHISENNGSNVLSTRGYLAKATAKISFGTMLQWFNFFIAAVSAALIWPHVFFQQQSSGISLSIVAFASAFVTRPFGAIIFGFIGDNFSRRKSIVASLFVMSLSSLAIGLTPSFGSIGVLSSILLLVFRGIQGFGMGGNWGSAVSQLAELSHQSKWHSFWTGWIQASLTLGMALATFSIAIMDFVFPYSFFITFGWRIIFVVGSVAVLVGGILSLSLDNSREFEMVKRKKGGAKVSIAEALKRGWKRILQLSLLDVYEVGTSTIVILPLSVFYLESSHHGIFTSSLTVTVAAIAAATLVVILGVITSIYGSRKKILLISTVVTALVLLFPYRILLNSDNLTLVFLAQIIILCSIETGYSVMASLFSQQYDVDVRSLSTGLTYQMSAAIAGIINITLIQVILASFNGLQAEFDHVLYVAIGLSVISFLATLFAVHEKKPESDATKHAETTTESET